MFMKKNVYKLILNSNIGRYGMNPKKLSTKILNAKEHNIVVSTRQFSWTWWK